MSVVGCGPEQTALVEEMVDPDKMNASEARPPSPYKVARCCNDDQEEWLEIKPEGCTTDNCPSEWIEPMGCSGSSGCDGAMNIEECDDGDIYKVPYDPKNPWMGSCHCTFVYHHGGWHRGLCAGGFACWGKGCAEPWG